MEFEAELFSVFQQLLTFRKNYLWIINCMPARRHCVYYLVFILNRRFPLSSFFILKYIMKMLYYKNERRKYSNDIEKNYAQYTREIQGIDRNLNLYLHLAKRS